MTESSPSAAADQRRTVVPTPAMVGGIVIGVFGAAFENIAVATAMPRAAEDLGGLGAYAWSFTLFIIGQLMGTAVAGRLADRIGPVRPMYAGMAVFVVGLLVAGFAFSWPQLLLGRWIQGLGAGAMFVSLTVIVARIFNPTHRAQVMAWMSAAWVVPAFVGPPIAGALAERASWHWVFFSVVPLVLAAGLLVRPIVSGVSRDGLLDGSSADTDPVPLWAPVVAAVGAIGLQAAGQLFATDRLWWAVAAALIGVVALLIALPPMMPAGFLRFRRGLSSTVWCRLLFPGAFFGAEAFVPLMLVQTRGMGLSLAGAVLSIGAVGWAIGAWLQSQSWVRVRRDRLILAGVLAVFTAIALAAVPAWLSWVPGWVLAIAWSIGGLGMGLAVATTSLVVMALSPDNQQGRNAASLQIGEGIGYAVFAGIAGSIFSSLQIAADSQLGFGTVITAMAVVAMLAIPFALRIGAVRDQPA
ncbi:MFS transporter [Naumannella halotolerans]|uniref:MFS transporter n=1 Tax=Naumannella halotolerans TaxID=993414 RepID=A0A4R7J999_9ACTN|nr:MFS transporter [Naumannella halotolerans]TDT34091.1 MFS transporter [Naumannella halotolerans]